MNRGGGCLSVIRMGAWDNALPVALAASRLFSSAGVIARVSGFAKVAREVLLWGCGAVGEADVVAISGFVGAGHCCEW